MRVVASIRIEIRQTSWLILASGSAVLSRHALTSAWQSGSYEVGYGAKSVWFWRLDRVRSIHGFRTTVADAETIPD